MSKWFYNNSLSLVFLLMFALSFGGESLFGANSYNQLLKAYGRPPIKWVAYIDTGDFLDGTLSNWQAAILQLTCLILGGSILHQKGAPHSRKLEKDSAFKTKTDSARYSWLYRHSLTIVFTGIFVVCMLGHMVFGTRAYNETNAMIGRSPISTTRYLLTTNFWSKTLQTWEAEFAAIVIYVILSVYLREEGSPESKPVNSPDSETGEANK